MTGAEALLAEARMLHGIGFEALRTRSATGVRTLRLVNLGEGDPTGLAAFVELEALVMDVAPVTPPLLAAIARLPRLRALEVCSHREAFTGWSGTLPLLELLSLPHLDVALAELDGFLHGVPNLRALWIGEAELRAVPPFVRELANLRELDLEGVPIPDAEIEALRRARPELVVRTSPINLGWAPGIPGVLRIPDGFALDDLPSATRWISSFETSIVGRQISLTVSWQESPADGPVYQTETHGPVAVEDFIRNGPPIGIHPWDRARLRQRLEAALPRRSA